MSCFDIVNSGYGGDIYPQRVKLGRWEDMVWEEEVERVEEGARPGWGWITLFYRSEARITSYIIYISGYKYCRFINKIIRLGGLLVGDTVREVVWRVGWNVGGESQERECRLNQTASYT